MPRKKEKVESEQGKNALSRRDFLKYSAVAGVVVGGISAGGEPLRVFRTLPVAAPSIALALNKDEFLENGAGKFAVDIPGCPVATANIHSVQVEDLTIDVRDTTSDTDLEFRTYAPGDAHFGKATFRSRVGKNSKELLQWLQDASSGKDVRKNIAVIILDKKGQQVRRWNLMECYPIKYDPGDYSPRSTTSVETIVVKISRVEFA